MKKLMTIFSLIFTSMLNANSPTSADFDQFQRLTGTFTGVYVKCVQICAERGYQYFVFRDLLFSDENGLKFELAGPQELDADFIQDSFEAGDLFPSTKVNFGIYCFKENPSLAIPACDIELFQGLIKALQMPIEQLEGAQVIEVSSLDELNQYVENADTPVFVDVFRETCPPCRELAPKYDQFSIDLAGKGIFLKTNIAEAKEIREKYEIDSVPTLLIFQNGKLSETHVGLPPILKALGSL